MTREEKTLVIESLKKKFGENDFFYLLNASSMTVGQVNELRSKFYKQNISMQVVKNTLVEKALADAPAEKGYAELLSALKGPTALVFTEVANAPARIVKDFRGKNEKPVLKGAYIDSSVYIGDDQLDLLASLKSKEELIGDIILLLQSPMKNVVGSLQSGGNTIMGLLKALEGRQEN